MLIYNLGELAKYLPYFQVTRYQYVLYGVHYLKKNSYTAILTVLLNNFIKSQVVKINFHQIYTQKICKKS